MSPPEDDALSGRDERFPRRCRLKRRRLIRALFDRRRTDTGTVAAGSVRRWSSGDGCD